MVANIGEATNVLERLKNHALITEEEEESYDYVEVPKKKNYYRIHDALLALALHILEQEGPKCYLKAGQSQMRDVGDAFTSNYSRISLVDRGISEIPLPKKNRVRVSTTTCLLLDYNTRLTALPSLSLFKGLKVLCLSHTGVVSLPHSIGQLKTLETLDLFWNPSLESIPNSLGNLANLSYMNLGSCSKLKSFPVDALLKLTKLVYLNGNACQGMWTCHRRHHRLFKHKKSLNRTFGRLYLDGMFQALTKLELQGLPDLDILRLLGLPLLGWDWSRFLRLRTLEVSCFGQSDFKVTSRMENLQELIIEDNDHFEGLPFLTQLLDVSLGATDAFPQLMWLQI
ncbi:hypothetical protein SELMODRAFT_407881 [Selaginella moellendorffii]|uniref:NB-ARC domain-containing protein n=1 Tax=Selaginella moellendorffii TaxID=88036 RepID=D8R526_SELML|nr:hypothetical protein SELMODRAFT_407881 [Selaginella moellendorffii]